MYNRDLTNRRTVVMNTFSLSPLAVIVTIGGTPKSYRLFTINIDTRTKPE